tara:strand:+ start:375 stop:671 length:297 start_codon:yes stop_codon:yes gene_type:complete
MDTIKKLYLNFLNSLNGLKFALKEHSFKIEIIGGLILIPYLFIINLNEIFKIIIFSIYSILLALELLNTSIEKLADKITKENDMDIKKLRIYRVRQFL